MKLHYLATQTRDPQERGSAIGRAYGRYFVQSAVRYRAHFAALGISEERVRAITERSRDALAAWYPEQLAESDAIAAASDVEPWLLHAVGARTEILAVASSSGEGECSTAVHLPARGGEVETIQTWDWHGHIATDGLVHRLTSGSGREVKLFTEFGTAAKIGVNDAGLGLHFNILSHRSDSAAGGVPVHAIARRILEEAATLDEAEAIAASATVSASTVFTIASVRDGAAEAASIEVSPAGVGVIEPDAQGWIVHTNHFLDPTLSLDDTMGEESTTRARYAHTVAALSRMAGRDARSRAEAFCGGAGADAPVCMRADPALPVHERWGTLLTIALDIPAFALELHAGTPYEAAAEGFSRF